MRCFIIILLCSIGIHAYAFDYAPFSGPKQAPEFTMHSVNNMAYMSSGSAYSPSVYDVSCSASTTGRGIRRAGGPGGTGGESGYDPSNPQFAPVGDALIPLLIMALIYMLVAYKRKAKVSDLCI